ncbi:hypothetical protein F4810DRAFT_617708 [Camillea tinctor]|nr:hypothetical protein F4810DRAFT_617708 [Camillea tinctor]
MVVQILRSALTPGFPPPARNVKKHLILQPKNNNDKTNNGKNKKKATANMSSSSNEPSSFLQFTRLPIEIRRHIWAFALPRGRIQLFARNVPWERWRLPAPAIARVCREAREAVLNHAVVRGFPTGDDRHNETWFVGSRDILELSSGYPYPLSNPEPFFAAAAALAVSVGDFRGDVRAVVRDLIAGACFPAARVVYLVVEQVSTMYWPDFRPDMTARDKGKGTILDLCDEGDQRRIQGYISWARSQEMSPVFPRREDVELPLRMRLDEIILEELREYQERMALESSDTTPDPSGQLIPRSGAAINREDPWVQEQWRRLPEFHPAILVLGWP